MNDWKVMMRSGRRLVALLAVVVVGACGSSATGRTGAATASTPYGATFRPTVTPIPTPALTGPIGTPYSFSLIGGYSYAVALTGVVDPAQPAGQHPEAPDAGKHYVVLQFTVVGTGGSFPEDDADYWVTVIGNDGNKYDNTGADATTCVAKNPNSPPYVFSVMPNVTVKPCLVAEVRDGVRVGKVEWGTSPKIATWIVSS